jgi:hypothetical protein
VHLRTKRLAPGFGLAVASMAVAYLVTWLVFGEVPGGL